MDTKIKYKTKQRKVLQEYLETVPGKHITVSEICDYFKEIKNPIGQATVYRNLEAMVDEGLVNKYIIDANSPACFEFIEKASEHSDEICFHCKCEKCGKLIHMHCDELNELESHLYEHHQFRMDPKRTVFYGICDDCQAGQ